MSRLSEILKDVRSQQDLILAPRVHRWLVDSGGEIVLTHEVAERIAALLTQVPRHRAGSFSPSSAGYCARRQVLGYLGVEAMPVDHRVKMIFGDGRFRHLRWQAIGLEAGWFTDIEVPAPVPEARSTGSIDAVNDREGWLFELKGTSIPLGAIRDVVALALKAPADLKDSGAHLTVRKWLLQMHRYMLAVGYRRTVLMVEHKASQEWQEFDIDLHDWWAEEATAELRLLNAAVDTARIPDMLSPCEMQSGEVWLSCPYRGDACTRATWVVPRRKVIKVAEQ